MFITTEILFDINVVIKDRKLRITNEYYTRYNCVHPKFSVAYLRQIQLILQTCVDFFLLLPLWTTQIEDESTKNMTFRHNSDTDNKDISRINYSVAEYFCIK